MSTSSKNLKFLNAGDAPLAKALFSVIPAPYESNTTFLKGQSQAPAAILETSAFIDGYDEVTGIDLSGGLIHTAPLETVSSADQVAQRIKTHIDAAIDAVAVPVIIGGDGVVTRWAVQAMLGHCNELSVLHLDAHSDLTSSSSAPDARNVIRQILDLPSPIQPTAKSTQNSAAQNAPTRPVSVVQVGVRSLSKDAYENVIDEDDPIQTKFMFDLIREDDEDWHDTIISELRSPIYVSIDLSVFDPSVIPSVGNPEPGGFEWWPLIRLLRKVAMRRRIAAFDVVEFCARPGQETGAYTAARLIHKLMSAIYSGGKMLQKSQ